MKRFTVVAWSGKLEEWPQIVVRRVEAADRAGAVAAAGESPSSDANGDLAIFEGWLEECR